MNLLSILPRIILFLILILFIYYFVVSKSFLLLFVRTNSMYPNIKKSSLILVSTEFKTYNIGDIVTYKLGASDEVSITHRIVDAKYISDNKTIYFTKGDNNEFVDLTPINASDILGKVVYVFPSLLGFIYEFKYFIYLMYLVLGYLFGKYLALIRNEKPKNRA